jgi:UDP-glucose 4-epimerase
VRFLVTGGAGFIGSSLANRLIKNGHEVRVIDDLSAGDKAALEPEIIFTRGDVNDVPTLWSLLQDIDCVFHLAARVSVPQSILYPREYNAVNVGGTVSVMEAMRDAGVHRVVFASSGAVYGKQAIQPVGENLPPLPDSPYAVSKLAAEHYVHTIGALWGIETVCLRIFNAYGPGQQLPASHWPVVSRFLSQTLSGGSIVLFGDGKQTRDYVYIDDVVEALASAATARKIDRLTLNIGSGIETSVVDLVELVSQATSRKTHVLYNTQEAGGVTRLCADISLARQRLDYKPKTRLIDGLRRTINRDKRFAKEKFA